MGLFSPLTAQSQPVRIHPDDGFGDLCGGARVRPLNKNGDDFLSVRESPSSGSREIDRVHTGDLMISCDRSKDSNWIGVIYAKTENQDKVCRINNTTQRAIAYRGPCKSGWVSAKYVDLND